MPIICRRLMQFGVLNIWPIWVIRAVVACSAQNVIGAPMLTKKNL